jgi:hypothetical protein
VLNKYIRSAVCIYVGDWVAVKVYLQPQCQTAVCDRHMREIGIRWSPKTDSYGMLHHVLGGSQCHTSQIKTLYVTTPQSDYLLETQIKSKTAPAYSGLLIGLAILLWFPFVRLFIFLPICFSFRLYLLLELAPGPCAVYI